MRVLKFNYLPIALLRLPSVQTIIASSRVNSVLYVWCCHFGSL